jgi:hypothetical protein
MCDATGLSQRRACRLTGLSLSTCRYDAQRPAADAHLSGRITELERRRFGYRRIWQLLRRNVIKFSAQVVAEELGHDRPIYTYLRSDKFSDLCDHFQLSLFCLLLFEPCFGLRCCQKLTSVDFTVVAFGCCYILLHLAPQKNPYNF